MDILKRIDLAQQFCKQYADGAWSIETEKWNHHVTPEFIEDIRQYIEQLQLKLMHEQTKQAKQRVYVSESYDMLDRYLRNNLYDDDYESYSEALDEVARGVAPEITAEYVPCYSPSIANMLEPQPVQSTNTVQPVGYRWYYTDVPRLLEEQEIVDLLGNCENGGWFKYHAFARAIEEKVRRSFGVVDE